MLRINLEFNVFWFKYYLYFYGYVRYFIWIMYKKINRGKFYKVYLEIKRLEYVVIW